MEAGSAVSMAKNRLACSFSILIKFENILIFYGFYRKHLLTIINLIKCLKRSVGDGCN
ncbi:hypothetical protein OBV_11780 [Oscillibacter valericigenes Sjm18-20]|nr:hypothetical protein OBV_11780 [Oscillibacter valericigenes Sjm18-20]